MLNYNTGVATSTIDGDGGQTVPVGVVGSYSQGQMRDFHWLRKSIITARKEQYFTPLASPENMPKHMGKTMKVYEYVPLLDSRNVNTEGLDANSTYASQTNTNNPDGNLYGSSKDIGLITGRLPVLGEEGGYKNRVGFTRIIREGSLEKYGFFYEFTNESLDFDSDDQLKDHLARELMTGAVQISEGLLQMDLLSTAMSVIVFPGSASSFDTISGDTGGSNSVSPMVVTYKDLMALDQELTNNRTPKQTRIVSGSRMIDTKVLPACRIMYVGSEIVPLLRVMQDPFGNPAFIGSQHYADSTNILNSEIGSIGPFRIIEVPEMFHWEGAGAKEAQNGATNPGYHTGSDTTDLSGSARSGTDYYNVYPLLVVGSDSFSTISFRATAQGAQFSVKTVMPGSDASYGLKEDRYGETGFSSIKWYYGFIAKRPERLGLCLTVAPE